MSQRPRFRFKTSYTTNIAENAGVVLNVDANATNSKPFAPHAGHTALDGVIDSLQVKWSTATPHPLMVGFFSGSTNAQTASSNMLIDYVTMATNATFINGTCVHYVKNGLSIPYRDASQGKQFHVGIYAYSATLTISGAGAGLNIEWTWRGEAGGGR